MGQGVWQQRHTRAVRSEKWWYSVAEYGVGMRVIAAFFGPYAPDALTSHVSVFSHDFKRFEQFTKLATSSLGTAVISTDSQYVGGDKMPNEIMYQIKKQLVCPIHRAPLCYEEEFLGFDHGVGHSFLLLCDSKAPNQ